MDIKTVGPWAVRMLLLALGGWLTRAGVGDAGLWGNLADTLSGPLVVAGTAVWSWRATRAQVDALPDALVGVTATLESVSAPGLAEEVAGKVMDQLKPHLPGGLLGR
jgi:hypothetical protein